MKKVKKIITYFVIGIATILLFTQPVEASSSDLYLNQLDFQAQVNQDGSMDVGVFIDEKRILLLFKFQ